MPISIEVDGVVTTEPESSLSAKQKKTEKQVKAPHIRADVERVVLEHDEFRFGEMLKDMFLHCCKHDPGNVEPKEDEYLMHIGEIDKTKLCEVFFPCNMCYKDKELDKEDESVEEHKDAEPDTHYTGKWDFIQTMGNYSVGLGNIWRFPAFIYENGGGTALIPYFVVTIFLAIPFAFLEAYLGQFTGRGPISVWAALPILKGVGTFMVATSFYISVYYNVVAAWSLHYLLNCFVEPLPWTYTTASWNKNKFWKKYTGDHNLLKGFSGRSPEEEYFDLRILNLNKNTRIQEDIHGELSLCLCVVWFIVFANLVFGGKPGKGSYVKMMFKFAAFFILIARAALLYGAEIGIYYYLTPQLDKLADPKIWGNAAVQVFFSLDVARGGWMAFASRNRFNNKNLFKHVLVIIVYNCVTSLFCGLAFFLAIGHLSFLKEMPVDKVINSKASSAGMVFIVYAEAIQKVQYSRYLCILLYGTFLFVALRTQIALCRSITFSITDERPQFFRPRQLFLILLICTAGMLHGLPITNIPFGFYLFNSLDKFITSVGFVFAALVFCFAMRWIYGYKLTEKGRFEKDFQLMWGNPPHRRLFTMMSLLLPIVTFVFMILVAFAYADNKMAFYDEYFDILFVIFLIQQVMYQAYKNYDRKKGVVVSLMASTLTTHLWGPQDPDVPYVRPDPPPDK